MDIGVMASVVGSVVTAAAAVYAIWYGYRQAAAAAAEKEEEEDTKTATAIALMQQEMSAVSDKLGKLDIYGDDIARVDKTVCAIEVRVGSLERWRDRTEKPA